VGKKGILELAQHKKSIKIGIKSRSLLRGHKERYQNRHITKKRRGGEFSLKELAIGQEGGKTKTGIQTITTCGHTT